MRNPSKKTINGKKLSLSKETLRQLNNNELTEVAGGLFGTTFCPLQTLFTTRGPTAGCTNPC